MFGFLKDKLKKAISKFTKDVKEEVEEKVEVKEEKKPEAKKERIDLKENKKQELHKEKKIEVKKEKTDSKEEKPFHKKEEIVEQKKPEIRKEEKTIKQDYATKEKIPDEKHLIKKEETKHEKPKEETGKTFDDKKEIQKKEHDKTYLKSEEKHLEEKKPHHISKEEPKIHTHRIEEPKKTGFFGKLKQTFSKAEEKEKPEKREERELEKEKEAIGIGRDKPPIEEEIEKKGFFEKLTEVVTKKTLTESKFDELFFELEIALLENNVALEVIDKIKSDLKKTLLSEKVSRVKTELVVAESLKNSIEELFDVKNIDLLKEVRKKKPYIICFVGVNGSGKTTNLAKLANYFQKNGFSVVIAACDTFRAAAIQQIEEHAEKLGVKLIKHDYGADSAAVAYDAIEHAKAKGKDVVLIDTAGRSHANHNLMEELQKVVRVSKPDLKIFVGDSLTGNDAVEQAQTFNEKVGIDGIILSKVDVDEKGGAAISVSYVTNKPIMFIGTGQTYDDLEKFEKTKITERLGF